MRIYAHNSYYLVLGQIASFIGLLISTAPWPENFISGLFILSGLALGFWSLWTMNQKGRLHFLPEVHPNSRLVTSGPYRMIRHPIYSSVIILSAGLYFNDPAFLRFVLLGILIAIHVFKLNYEEKLLSRTFSEYTAYRKGTWRLFPGVY